MKDRLNLPLILSIIAMVVAIIALIIAVWSSGREATKAAANLSGNRDWIVTAADRGREFDGNKKHRRF